MVRGTADPSAALGMTKGRVVLPFGVMVATATSQTLFIPPSTCRRQAQLLGMKNGREALRWRAGLKEVFSDSFVASVANEVQPLLSMEALPSPLSSRAQPRDLQFRGPLLEMFSDREKRNLLFS